MISFGRIGKPKLIEDVRIDVVGDGERMVLMSMETIDHKKVTVGMLPETAFEMLEELSITTLGVAKREKRGKDVMFG